jgi:hypothetical protein
MKTDTAVACRRKRRFTTRIEADAHALESMVRPHRGKPVVHLYVYRCDHCTGWHLTKKFHPLPQSRLWPTGELGNLLKP